jgi:hypothetical protein
MGANEYATLEQLKATLEIAGETFADDDLQLALSAASRGIDQACDRRFYPDDDAAQERFYSPESERFMKIDDLFELTSLESGTGDGSFPDTWTENQDFVLEPLNAPFNSEPWSWIEVPTTATLKLPADTPRSVKLTGRFGWPEVPAQIQEATVVLASKLMRRAREAPFGVVGLGIDGAAVRVARTDPDINFLIDPYRQPSVV